VYGQTQVQADLVAASEAAGRQVYYDTSDAALHDLGTDHPFVTFTDANGTAQRIDAVAVAGCDGSFGPSRAAMPDDHRDTWERVYPYSWLGILADVAPSTDELIYAWHPDGFAMHSMRSATVSRLYLQVDPHEDIANWPDERIWDELDIRLGTPGWSLERGEIFDKSITPMHSFVGDPMRYGKLFLVGDSAHIVPPTGAKGLNLAIADASYLHDALIAWYRNGDDGGLDEYSPRSLERVWKIQHFSTWMTRMLHRFDESAGFAGAEGANPENADYDYHVQLGQLRQLCESERGMAHLAERYTGLPFLSYPSA